MNRYEFPVGCRLILNAKRPHEIEWMGRAWNDEVKMTSPEGGGVES